MVAADPRLATGGDVDAIPRPAQPLLHQPGQAGIVLDIEDAYGLRSIHRALSSLRYHQHRHEKAELANGVGELLVIHRLGNVDVAAELIKKGYPPGIIGGGE